MFLAVSLFVIASITAFGTLATILASKDATSASFITLMNTFCIVVEILAAFRLLKG